MMVLKICGKNTEVPEGTSLQQAIRDYSPFGEEAAICRLNGETVRSIDAETDRELADGDVLEIFPLIIGG